MTRKLLRKRPNEGRSDLTNRSRYYSVCRRPIEDQANHAECGNTLHGSNPTLYTPVNGLRSIILLGSILVLHRVSGPTDSSVGLGRLVFQIEKR